MRVEGSGNETSQVRANSTSSNDEAKKTKPKSLFAKLFSLGGNKDKTSGTEWPRPGIEAEPTPASVEAPLAETLHAASGELKLTVGEQVTSVTTRPSDSPVESQPLVNDLQNLRQPTRNSDGDSPSAAGSPEEPQEITVEIHRPPRRADSVLNPSDPEQVEEQSPTEQEIVGASIVDPANVPVNDPVNDLASSVEQGSVLEGPAVEPSDTDAEQTNAEENSGGMPLTTANSNETVVKEIAVEKNAEINVDEIVEDKVTAQQFLLPTDFTETEVEVTDEELQAVLDAMPEPNDVTAAPESTGNDVTADRWEGTVDGTIANLSNIEDELTKSDDDFAALNEQNETPEVDSVELGMLDQGAQDATRRWSAAIDPTTDPTTDPAADPVPGASTGASGGPAAAVQPAPSPAVGNSTCASQFDAMSLNMLFTQGGPEQKERVAGIFKNSENDYAKVIVVDFANLLRVSFLKIMNNGNLTREQKKKLVAPLQSLAIEYISLIESEGLDKKSPFGPFYFGQNQARNKRINIEAKLVMLSGGNTAEGAKRLRDVLIEKTVRPFINKRLKEMFGGSPIDNTTSLMEKMVEERAQAVLAKISVAAENYSKHPHGGTSVRGLAFGFSLVTLWPELLRKIWDDETTVTTAVQGETPAAGPAEGDDGGDPVLAGNVNPSTPVLPPAPAGAPSNPIPAGSPEAALLNGLGSGAGGGIVINGNVIFDNSDHSDNRVYYQKGGAFGRDGSDASSEDGGSVLSQFNLARHDRSFPGSRIASPKNSEVRASDSETSESDADSEEGDDTHSTAGSFDATRNSASERSFITLENQGRSKSRDEYTALARRNTLDSEVGEGSFFPSERIEGRTPTGNQPTHVEESSADEVDGGVSARRKSVTGSLYETSDGRASPESGFGSDAEKSKGASRQRISASSPLKPGSFTLKSEFRPSAQGASAIKSVIIGRIVKDLGNGWVQIENDGKKSWMQVVMDGSDMTPREVKDVELTVPRRGKYHLLDVKPSAPKLPHPWADSWANSEWIEGNRLSREIAGKQIQAENTLMVGAALDATKPVGQPNSPSLAGGFGQVD